MTYIEPTIIQRVGEYFDGLLWKGINLYFDVLGVPRVSVSDRLEFENDDAQQR